jgi:hypothetical protein
MVDPPLFVGSTNETSNCPEISLGAADTEVGASGATALTVMLTVPDPEVPPLFVTVKEKLAEPAKFAVGVKVTDVLTFPPTTATVPAETVPFEP